MWPLHSPERRIARISFRGEEALIEGRVLDIRPLADGTEVGAERCCWLARALLLSPAAIAPVEGFGCAERMIEARERAIRECAERWLMRRLGRPARRPVLRLLRNADRSIGVASAASTRLATWRARHDLLDKLMLMRWRMTVGDGRRAWRRVERWVVARRWPSFTVLLRDDEGFWGAATHSCRHSAEQHARQEVLLQRALGERDPMLLSNARARIAIPAALAIVSTVRPDHVQWQCDGRRRHLAFLS